MTETHGKTRPRRGGRAARPDKTASPRRPNALEGLLHGATQLLLPFFEPASEPRTPAGRRCCVELPDGRRVDYTLVRRRRRSIGFMIDDRGLTVTAPNWVGHAAVADAVDEKRRWIMRKLDEWRHYEQRRERLAGAWRDGGRIRYLGRPCVLVSARGGTRFEAGDPHDTLHLPDDGDDLRALAERWIREQAGEWLDGRLAHFSARSGLRPSRWRLSNARTLWGSCTAQGVIHLNWRLMHLPPDLIDYVVVHELAHLREMNHGPAFWALVEQVLPDYDARRSRLREMPEHLSA